jgi:Helix-turn-helix domain
MSHSALRSPDVKPRPQTQSSQPWDLNRAILASDLGQSSKVLLLVIVDHAGHGRSKCTASTDTLARESGMTGRHVRRLLPALEADGWIQIERATGSRQSRHAVYTGSACFGPEPREWDDYQEYLASDWWKERRAKTLAADGYRCRLCSSTDNLNVHHRCYSRLGAEPDNHVITLCHECHAKFHDRIPAGGDL